MTLTQKILKTVPPIVLESQFASSSLNGLQCTLFRDFLKKIRMRKGFSVLERNLNIIKNFCLINPGPAEISILLTYGHRFMCFIEYLFLNCAGQQTSFRQNFACIEVIQFSSVQCSRLI